ncbi:Cytochrome c oxidase subunit Vb [Aphelenchoides bicaudatus]|nr:Cytochrome c oxidase subunit Vb [Aphelenchoides bicaudatus]
MAGIVLRSLSSNLTKAPRAAVTTLSQRSYASEASPEDYGYYPDPLEHAMGREKKMLIARLAGDDRYEPKVYYRAEKSTREKPNLVPAHFPRAYHWMFVYVFALIYLGGRSTGEVDSGHVNFQVIRKGPAVRCECGHWFKAIDADPESV